MGLGSTLVSTTTVVNLPFSLGTLRKRSSHASFFRAPYVGPPKRRAQRPVILTPRSVNQLSANVVQQATRTSAIGAMK
jgi:hypothetical protein